MFRLDILLGLGTFSLISAYTTYHHHVGPRHRCYRRSSRTTGADSPLLQKAGSFLFMSSAERVQQESSMKKKKSSSNSTIQVLYQKVVRPFPNLPDILFLGYLVDYIENYFAFPNGLPMIYEKYPGNEETRSIIAWDSPLSPSSEATRMEIEVVGIYTDRTTKADEDDSSSSSSSSSGTTTIPSIPKMAMVVVRKSKSANMNLPPMMINLFQDSEKKILRALDRGLEDFMTGKIKFTTSSTTTTTSQNTPTTTTKIPYNIRTVEEAIEAELMDSIPERIIPSTKAQDVIFDAYATTEVDNPFSSMPQQSSSQTTQVNANNDNRKTTATNPSQKVTNTEHPAATIVENNNKQSSSRTSLPTTKSDPITASKGTTTLQVPKPLEDYAVAAARRVRELKEKRQHQQQGQSPTTTTTKQEDFAVSAARKVAAAAGRKQSKGKSSDGTPIATTATTSQHENKETTPASLLGVSSDFKIPDYMGGQRTFRTTISRPQDRVNKKKKLQETTIAKVTPPMEQQQVVQREGTATATTKPNVSAKTNPSLSKPKKETSGSQTVDSRSTKRSSNRVQPSQEEIEREVAKAAQVAMDEIAAEGDITPEQLLKDILKFGEENEKKDTPGEGFVSAAFDKAKDLMREQYEKQRQTRGKELGFREPQYLDGIRPNIKEPETLSAEEELKRMFEAGERIADGRISQSETKKDVLIRKETTNEDIDTLIANEKSISGFARSLDDQLVALEVAINKSPGEELDSPMKYPMFDIMSGPEVYNPNVDPDTVNYPGALPGTKNVDIPQELKEAIRQAQFAVEVLVDITPIEVDGTTKYMFGKQELTELQVQQLQTVASEAIEIGLIKNPVKLADESSRLQMVLDELSDQPEERFRSIAENFKDLLLSDNFVDLVKARLKKMAERDLDALRRDDDSLRDVHEREREILGKLVVYAQLLLKEARALGAELEAQQLEVIRSICQVAMDPKHQSEEETAIALSDAVRDMRPLLDESFVAYLKYAVAEEEARLARAGLLDDPEHSQWLFVLKIVQQGVYAEISKSINRYIDHIWYIIRMETPRERRMLLSKLIDAMPTMDVRPFVKVVDNVVGALGDSTRGEFAEGVSLGEMTNKLLQLHRDVRELLPPERILEKSRDADEWAAKQKERLLEARKIGKQRLKAANEVADRQDEIDATISRRGETERFDS